MAKAQRNGAVGQSALSNGKSCCRLQIVSILCFDRALWSLELN